MFRSYASLTPWLTKVNKSRTPTCGCTKRILSISKQHRRATSSSINVQHEQESFYKEKVRPFGYTVTEISDVPDYNAKAVLLKHERTGAEHLHIERDDQNNVFSVAFRTTPFDSTGVPHILEHTALCGSQKYPVRDPFFKMLNRSLATYMNALTASDWTLYPFATQNPNDFSNLMSVYLDAAFFPKLTEKDFRQEGWRLEHSDLEDPSSDVIFKGVVFNEMKGALSDAESIFCTHHQSLLLPSHTYGYISGGDPLHIPRLTHDDLKNFHKTHYHPSNSKFFTYGNFSLEEHLERINNHVLKNFEKINPRTEIPIEPKWSQPREAQITCAPDIMVGDELKQCMLSVSFMLDYSDDPFDAFTMSLLSALLVSGPNSPFYQALIESNLGSDYSPTLGLDNYTKNTSFSVGLQGLREEDIDKVVSIIQQTFERVAQEGFDERRIESLLHSIELAQKHQTSNFGMALIMSLTSSWNYDKNPIKLLELTKQVQRFKDELQESPNFLRDKVREYFIENSHKLTLSMKPDKDHNSKKEQAEMELLQEKLKDLSEADIKDLHKQGVELELLQNADEDISVLPKMRVSDIEKHLKETVVEHTIIEDVKIQTSRQPTNGVTYFRAIATTTSIPYILKPYLPLFCHVLTKVGAAERTYKDLAQQVELCTGGISASTHLSPNHSDLDTFEQGILLSSHCLQRNIPMMFSLCQDILNSPTFNNPERLKTLISAYANDLAMSIAQSGQVYAMAAASKNLSPSAQLAEMFGGISQVQFMKGVAEAMDMDDVIENLMKIAMYLLNVNELRCSVNTTDECMEPVLDGLEEMLSSLNAVGFNDDIAVEDADFIPRSRKVYYDMDLPVNYVSKCVRTVPYTHEDHARLQVLAKVMSAKFLHREIREKGGAYGSGAKIGGGVFSFFSYRDPNNLRTLEVFDDAVTWAGRGEFKDDDIEEAKLSLFSSIDSPVSPGNRGMTLFQSNLSDELRQQNRDRLFNTDKDDIVRVAQTYLFPGKEIDAYAIVGSNCEELLNDSTWKKPQLN